LEWIREGPGGRRILGCRQEPGEDRRSTGASCMATSSAAMSSNNAHTAEVSDQNEALRRENADLYAQIKALSQRLAQGSAGEFLSQSYFYLPQAALFFAADVR
jgi:hypothetical protein